MSTPASVLALALLRTVPVDLGETPVDDWRPRFVSSPLTLVNKASPDPSVDSRAFKLAASLARSFVSTVTDFAWRRRPSVTDTMSTLPGGTPAVRRTEDREIRKVLENFQLVVLKY